MTQETPDSPVEPRTGPVLLTLRPLLAVAFLSGFVVGGMGWVSPFLGGDPRLAYGAAFVSVSTMALAAARFAPTLSWRWLAVVLLGGGAGLAVLGLWGEALPLFFVAVAVTVILLFAGSVLGGAVGGRIEHPGHLIVVVLVSLVVDSFSVFHEAGPTAALVQRPSLIALLALPWPLWGTSTYSPILGFGDVVFAGLYMAAARRFDLGLWKTSLALALGLAVTLAAVILLARPIPALVGMGLAMVFAHRQARRLPDADRRRAFVGCALLLALWCAAWLWG